MNDNIGASPAYEEELKRTKAQLHELVDVDRRVMNRRKTVQYVAFDAFKFFSIDGHKDLFRDSILKISLPLQSLFNVIAGVWDIADDFLVGALIEKTRTRWGKFVPHIFLGGIPYALISSLYWLIPLLFSPEHVNDFSYMPKFVLYMILEMAIEFLNNIRVMSTEGYLSTITPYPSDRRRLTAISGYASVILSNLPSIILEALLDFVTNGIVKSTKGRSTDEIIGRAMITVGPVAAMISGLAFTLYSMVAKERVHQKIERTKVLDSLKVVISNRPVLIYMISNAIGSFGTGLTTNDYYRQVLRWTTYETIAGIPSVFFQPIGFAKYNDLASRFSTRTLYCVGQSAAKTLYIPLFFYGVFIKDRKGKQFFKNRWAMLPVTALWEIIYATFWGVRTISINEMRNECNDYLEWRYGYRSEGTLSAASSFITKIPARINGVLQPKYKQWIDYDQTAYTEGREQPKRAQPWIFAMATIIPAFVILLSLVPMIWFNIDKNTRDRMYRELNERRAATAKLVDMKADGTVAEQAPAE